MNEARRHQSILSLLEKNQSISISHIVEHYSVSPATARRDISKLNEQGKLKKVRNGAECLKKTSIQWSPLNIDSTQRYKEKCAIAMAAAKLCKKGDSVVINCGSTAFLLGQQLCGKNVQLVTNYFPLASYLIREDHDDLIILGGQYHKAQNILLSLTHDFLSGYAGNWMFTSGKGLTEAGLYKADMLSAVSEQQMIKQIATLVAVVDSSKVGQRTGMLFCPIEKIDILITGKEANPNTIKSIKEQGTEVILV